MNRLDRQTAPAFWADKEQQFLDGNQDAGIALRQWSKDGKTLARWFHEGVRPNGEPSNCAYCDGPLGETSSETIDHFVPWHIGRVFGLDWKNLFPACQACNTDFKGKRWWCELLRPDLDPVEDWIEFEPNSGRLSPAPDLDFHTRVRIRVTIRVFGLNEPVRCTARRRIWKSIQNAAKKPADHESLETYSKEGPYRLVSRLFIKSQT